MDISASSSAGAAVRKREKFKHFFEQNSLSFATYQKNWLPKETGGRKNWIYKPWLQTVDLVFNNLVKEWRSRKSINCFIHTSTSNNLLIVSFAFKHLTLEGVKKLNCRWYNLVKTKTTISNDGDHHQGLEFMWYHIFLQRLIVTWNINFCNNYIN